MSFLSWHLCHSLVCCYSLLLPTLLCQSTLFYFCWLLLLASSDTRSLFLNLGVPPTSSLFTNDLCFPLSFFPYFILLFPTYSLVQGCPFLVPLFLQVVVLGTHRHEALSSMVWLNVLWALPWGELACLCCVRGAWSALRAKRGGDGAFGELNFWNGSLLSVGKGSRFDFTICCLGLRSKLLLKDNSALWIVQFFAVARHSEMW